MKRLILLVLLSTNIVFGGQERGNGGDTFAEEFNSIAYSAIQKLKENKNTYLTAKEYRKLSKALRKTSVHSTCDQLKVGRNVKDAINRPFFKKITFNRKWWIDNQFNLENRVKIVLHEYLSIKKIEKRDTYGLSRNLTDFLAQLPGGLESLVPKMNTNVSCEEGITAINPDAPLEYLEGSWKCRNETNHNHEFGGVLEIDYGGHFEATGSLYSGKLRYTNKGTGMGSDDPKDFLRKSSFYKLNIMYGKAGASKDVNAEIFVHQGGTEYDTKVHQSKLKLSKINNKSFSFHTRVLQANGKLSCETVKPRRRRHGIYSFPSCTWLLVDSKRPYKLSVVKQKIVCEKI